jgi:O-antigen ligase
MRNSSKSWSNLLAVTPAVLLLFVLPLNHANAVRMTALFLAASVALYYLVRRAAPPLPLKLPLALWAGLALLSVSWSTNPGFSLGEFKTEIVYGLIAFASFFVVTQDRMRLITLVAAALLGTLVTLLIAAAHFATSSSAMVYEWEWQHGPVSYSTYLATISPLLIYASLHPWQARWVRPLMLLTWLLFLFIAYKTGNRMFWLSLGGAGFLFMGLVWMKLQDRKRARMVALSALAGLALIGALFVLVAQQRLVDPMQQAQPATDGALAHAGATLAQSERYEIWRYWVERIKERPWSGVGFGRDLPHMVYEKPAAWFDLMFAHAHNLFLDYALQLGIPGVAVLLLLLGALAREFMRLYRHPNQEAWMLGVCGLAVLVAMLSKNMTDDLFWRTDALLFWALMGMLLGYGSRLRYPKQQAMDVPR